jgi:hypothetical protein
MNVFTKLRWQPKNKKTPRRTKMGRLVLATIFRVRNDFRFFVISSKSLFCFVCNQKETSKTLTRGGAKWLILSKISLLLNRFPNSFCNFKDQKSGFHFFFTKWVESFHFSFTFVESQNERRALRVNYKRENSWEFFRFRVLEKKASQSSWHISARFLLLTR